MKVRNLDIWLAIGPINQLGQIRLPVRTSLAVAKLGNKLVEMRKPIETVRAQLVEQYAEKDEAGKPIKLESGNIKLADAEGFSKAFTELMEGLCETDVLDAKIKLPEKITVACDKCHHNMDGALTIEPAILMALEPFLEVA